MICPYCGNVDRDIEIPEKTKEPRALGRCENCGEEVWACPTTKRSESSPLETVREGESREEELARIYLDHEEGVESLERERAADIDRRVIDEGGDLLYFLEIKERSCSLNGYRKTKFPFAKIEEGKELAEEHEVPVFIILKFRDCWARLRVSPEDDYEEGDEPFAPRYRPWQRNKDRQVPVMIPVEELEILPWREGCEDINS